LSRRVGRYTKDETAELGRIFGEGYSVYKIFRNVNRSQKSIRNKLIRLSLIEGEITPRCYPRKRNDLVVNDSIGKLIFNYTRCMLILSFLTMMFVINPHFNIIEIIITNFIFIIL